MFTQLSDLAKGLIFYAIVLVLAIAFTFLPLEGETVARLSMFIPFIVVLGGLLYGYLRVTTNGTWPASLAHSTHNYLWALFGFLTFATSPVAAEYLAGEGGILIILGYGIAAAWLLRRLNPTAAERRVG